MIMRHAFAALLMLCAAPAFAQEVPTVPPTPPASPTPPATLTRAQMVDRLLELFEASYAPRIGQKADQTALYVAAAVTPDVAPRPVDYGAVLFTQTISPQWAARLKGSPNGRVRLGEAGDPLWRVASREGDYFCGGDVSRNIDTVICFADRDADGSFEKMFTGTPLRFGSRFQIIRLGRDARLRAPVPFEPMAREAGPAYSETLEVRFIGPAVGLVKDGDMIGPGEVEIVLRSGVTPERMSEQRKYRTPLDATGAGTLELQNGIHLDVSGVQLDGRAQVRVHTGLPAGAAEIAPALSREDIDEMKANLRERLMSDAPAETEE